MINTFQIDSTKTFVSGLFWHPLSGAAANHRKETAELAKELNFDLAVWLTSTVPQVGFASRNDVNPGWISAAAAISKSLQNDYDVRDFLCALEVPGGEWLYVAQRDGVLLPDGDMIGSSSEIQARLLQDLSLGSWPLVYAPADWAIHGAVEDRTFEDFLPQKNGKIDYKNLPAIQSVKQWGAGKYDLGSLKKLAIPAMLAVAAYYGYSQWQNHQAMQQQLQQQAAAPLPHPWKTQPRAEKYLQACAEALPNLGSLWPGNWHPKDITCAGGSFTAVWSRNEHGWIEHLRKIQPKVVIVGDGSNATLSVPVKMPAGEDEIAPTEGERNIAMYNAAQKYRFKITLTPVPPPPPPPPPEDGEPPPPVPDWREIKWNVETTELPPHIIVQVLDGNGFRITQIKKVFTNGKTTWTLEGIQYVQL